jgi:cytidyltransferase-like protein
MALQKLREHFQTSNINSFNDMLKNRVVVTEKISAPSFHVRRTFNKFEYYKSGKGEAMNMVDRTVVKLYEAGVKHIQSLDPSTKEKMPTDWKFGFEYLPENNISEFQYEELPKNSLILNHIQQIGANGKVKKIISDPSVLNKWADILEVQRPSVIFDGILDENQKKELVELLSTSDSEFNNLYDYDINTEAKTSFTMKAFKMFEKASTRTTLCSDLEKEIDGLVLTFSEGGRLRSFKLEDFTRKVNENRSSSHIYQLTITDMLEYMTVYDLSSIQLTEESADYRYMELMSAVFNEYLKENSTKYIGVNFESADFADSDSFRLNTKYIKNETTLKYVSNPILAELFKITLGSFRKKKSKTSDILDEDMIARLNDIVEKIETLVFVENTDKNSIYDFKNYMLHNKVKQSTLNEALTVKYKEQGKEPVNMFVGRFQPFTLGHAKVLETIHKQNGFPVVVFLVKAKNKKKEDSFKRPYDEATQLKMFKAVQKQYPFLKEIYVIPTAAIDVMFNEMRPKYEPVLWGTGSDRMKVYGYQVNNDKYREDLGVKSDFGLYEIPRTDDNISATKVRNAMLDGDEKSFKKMTPKSLHKLYGELKKKLEDSVNSSEDVEIKESVLTFKQFIEK